MIVTVVIVTVMIVTVMIVLVIVQMVSNDAHFFRQSFFHHSGLSLAPRDAAHVRRIHSQALRHAIVDAPKKRDGRDRICVTIHFVTIHDEPFRKKRGRAAR